MSTDQIDYAGQQKLVAALVGGHCFPHALDGVRLIETHISWVLIAGIYAYKIKKALNLGFLNFTNLPARQFYCNEELRLNRRLAAGVYLDVIPIGGKADAPEIGAQPAIEYAVRMLSFIPENQLDHLLEQGKILPQQLDDLAASLADFHRDLPPAKIESEFGKPAAIHAVTRQNFEQLRTLLAEKADCDAIANLSGITEIALSQCEKYFNQRHQQGYVRECHGDLHMGNIVLIEKRLVPFDGIEFDPALRWIDVLDEVSFLVMDLLHAQRSDLAFRFLNAYLEQTGDYAGLSVLSFYMAYRAMVRAKVCALRASQAVKSDDVRQREMTACRSYLALAAECLTRHRPVLMITHGLPGSGKSTFAKAALEKYQAIRIRSDVERKRLSGLLPLDDSRAILGNDLYSADMTWRTYNHLHELARQILSAGYSVIVDAAFLKQDERAQFYQLALNMSVPFAIISMKATTPTLKSRVMLRRNSANDASEADVGVLEKLQIAQDLLFPHEIDSAVEFQNENDSDGIAADNPGWAELERLLLLRQ